MKGCGPRNNNPHRAQAIKFNEFPGYEACAGIACTIPGFAVTVMRFQIWIFFFQRVDNRLEGLNAFIQAGMNENNFAFRRVIKRSQKNAHDRCDAYARRQQDQGPRMFFRYVEEELTAWRRDFNRVADFNPVMQPVRDVASRRACLGRYFALYADAEVILPRLIRKAVIPHVVCPSAVDARTVMYCPGLNAGSGAPSADAR